MTPDHQPPPLTAVSDNKPLILALCTTGFLATLMYSSLSPFFSEIGDDLDVSVPALGQVITVRLLLSAALALLAGPLADRFGYRRVIAVGLAGLVVNFLGISASQSLGMLFVSSVPGGIAGATLSGLPLAMAGTLYAGEARRKAISYSVAALSSSAIIGVPALTTASSVLGWRGVFLATAIVSFAASLFIWRSLPKDGPAERKAGFARSSISGPYRMLLGNRQMVRLYTSTYLRATGWIGFLTYLGAYLADDIGFGVTTIGAVYMIGGTGYFLGSLAAGRNVLPGTPLMVASLMTLVTGVMVLLVVVFEELPLLVVLAVCGVTLSSSLAWVMFTTLMSSTTPASQGTTMSFNSTIQSLGAATGGIIGGVLIALSGYFLMGAGLAIVLIASGLLIILGAKSSGNEN